MKQSIKLDLTTAQGALNGFLDSWLREEWGPMSKCCSKTWRTKIKKPSKKLKMFFGATPICLYEVREQCEVKELNSAVCVDIVFDITLKGYTLPIRYVARIIKERKALKADAVNGTWGVNPPSALRMWKG